MRREELEREKKRDGLLNSTDEGELAAVKSQHAKLKKRTRESEELTNQIAAAASSSSTPAAASSSSSIPDERPEKRAKLEEE